jgi:methylglyoxal synthase
MVYRKMKMATKKNIALIAHDNRKQDLLEWVKYNKGSLERHNLFATGTTGLLVNEEVGIEVTRFKSGPLGGDQQVGAKIADNAIDFLIFLWDPMEPHPHDPDVKALLRLSVVWNIPVACNRATADFLISSPLMNEEYERLLVDYEALRKEVLG